MTLPQIYEITYTRWPLTGDELRADREIQRLVPESARFRLRRAHGWLVETTFAPVVAALPGAWWQTEMVL